MDRLYVAGLLDLTANRLGDSAIILVIHQLSMLGSMQSWLEPIGTAHVADKELIEGCKADLFFERLVKMI